MRFSRLTHLLMCLSLETLTSIIRTGLSILVELIFLVNSVIIFLSQATLLRWLIFFTDPRLWYSHSCSLHVFLSSDASICSTMAFPNWEILIMLLSQFSLNFYHIHNGMPRFIALLMTNLELIDTVLAIIWEMFHGRISLNTVVLLLLVNFVSGFQLKLMYISLIGSNQLSLTHLPGFQLLVLLP